MSWVETVDYREVLAQPHTRSLIDDAGKGGSRGMSAEDFLKGAEKVLGVVGLGAGVPLETMGKIVAPIYAKMGVQTGKSLQCALSIPPGRAILAALCSFAKNHQSLCQVEQGSDGVMLIASLPSDAFAFEGTIMCGITRVQGGTRLEAATKIPGQMFDWGKSTRALARLQEEIGAFATIQP